MTVEIGTNGNLTPTNAAAEREAFFDRVGEDVRGVVASALQQGWTTEQVKEAYAAVLARAGEYLHTQYGIPAAYLTDILPEQQRIELLLAAIGAAGRERDV